MENNPNQPGARKASDSLDPKITPGPAANLGGRFASMHDDAEAVAAAQEAAQPHSLSEALAAAGRHLKELQNYVSYYIAAKTDGIKLTVKNIVVYAGLGVVGLIAAAGRHLKELQNYASYYIAAKTDGIKLTLKNVVIYAGLGVVGLVAAGALLVVAVVQLCYGIAGALGALFGGRLWLGELVTGFLLLAGTGAAAYFALSSLTRKSRKATVQKYEARQRQQRQDYGHDVNERAREQRLQQA